MMITDDNNKLNKPRYVACFREDQGLEYTED